jgi:hypothetical protein
MQATATTVVATTLDMNVPLSLALVAMAIGQSGKIILAIGDPITDTVIPSTVLVEHLPAFNSAYAA